MKLIVQIPCFNEADSLPQTLLDIPRAIDGIDCVELLVIDDGSSDNTAEIARRFGVHHIVRHRANRGLAAAFQSGINAALAAGADIIVNTDADGQYDGGAIPALVEPIIQGRADIVVGDRGVASNAHFGPIKRQLQKLGSFVVQRLARAHAPDAVSGFRAISREAAQRITITAEFSYTTDMLIQAGRKRLNIVSVPVNTNRTERPSRLFRSIPQFIMNTGATMARTYTMYNPLRVFVLAGSICNLIGLLPIARFGFYVLHGEGSGHVQSLVLGGALLVLGTIAVMLGILADLIAGNRKLMEATLEHVRRIENQMALERREQKAASADEQSALGVRRRAKA